MIGVIPKPGQEPLVEEFFELFKTPWEFHRSGTRYDVVVATRDAAPDVMPRLLIIYSAAQTHTATEAGAVNRLHGGGTVLRPEGPLPIYGELLTFQAGASVIASADVGPVAFKTNTGNGATIRVGFDLFDQLSVLLSAGQPVSQAHVPTLDVHIAMLRSWIVDECIPFVEVAPCPAEHDFAVCLTHDIDFVGIRRHVLDHTMWGFLYRSTLGGILNTLRGRLSLGRLWKMWKAAASLPFVYAGWLADFWEPFEWYLATESHLPATYYLIPFKAKSGEKVSGRHAGRRAVAYDVSDVQKTAVRLVAAGCEVGVHGIDAWHSVEKGRAEMTRVANAINGGPLGIRMHWLLRDEGTNAVLDQAGYTYDSTSGYNETIGYRAGTSQVFRPLEARTLLELPMHIQDGALFYPQRLDLTEREAESRCQALIDHARRSGGVLTLLWHDRSHGPERFWGDFYRRLVEGLRSTTAWFGTGSQVVGWFRARRAVRFVRPRGAVDSSRVILRHQGGEIRPSLRVRIHRPAGDRGHDVVDIPWNGTTPLDVDPWHRAADAHGAPLRAAASL